MWTDGWDASDDGTAPALRGGACDDGTAPALRAAASMNDPRITADRSETKYLVTPEAAVALEREIERHLPAHYFGGHGAISRPGWLTFATTVYFDTANRDLYREALGSAVHSKLRVREYYAAPPEEPIDPPIERADVAQLPALLWLEIKHRDGTRSRKRRIGLTRHELAPFLKAGIIGEETVELARAEHGAAAADVLADVAEICRRYPTRMRPSCVVDYRRSAFQEPGGSLRITVDHAVAFFAPPADLFARDVGLMHAALGQPKRNLDVSVVEIKSRGSQPAWLGHMTANYQLRAQRFSKFVAALRNVHDSA
jgi:SPX domain protein involved in polyphosphate accumulation